MEFARRGGEVLLHAAGFGNSGFGCGAKACGASARPAARHRRARGGSTARAGRPARAAAVVGCDLRRGANRAQIAFDHRQAIDHMAERVVNRLQRILGAAVGFRLAEADVGQFALDDVDEARSPSPAAPARCMRLVSASETRLACWRSRWRRMSCSPSSTRPRLPERAGRWRLRAVPADTTRAVRDGQTPRRCRCRPACGRGVRTARAARLRSVPNCRSPPAARGFPASRSARRCAVREWRRNRCCRRRGTAGRPWTTACARLRKAAPAHRWRRRWRRSSAAPRSRLRAGERSRGRRWRAGSGRAWRRDCGSPRHSR